MEKKRLLFIILICWVVGMSITSCLGSDDNENKVTVLYPLTKEQKAAQLRDMAGLYNGYIYFTNDTTGLNDSIPMSWTVTAPDSTFRINNFPVKVLANGVSDLSMRKLFNNENVREVSGNIIPYVNEFNKDNYYTYMVMPANYALAFTIQEGETQHQVNVEFANQMAAYTSTSYYPVVFYSNGEYSKSQMLAFLLVKTIKVDSSIFTTGRALYFYGKK